MGNPKFSPDPPRWSRKNFYIFVASVVLAVVVLVVILLAVFRPKQAIMTVNSVKLDGLKVGFSFSNLAVDLNTTLLLNISVKNPNKAGFDYENGNAQLYYRGVLVGEAVIPKGEIEPGETIEILVRLTIMADRIVSDRNLYSDVMDGKVTVATTTWIPGKVTILGLKHPIVMYTTCDVTINVVDRTVQNSNSEKRLLETTLCLRLSAGREICSLLGMIEP